ncbi:MAG: GNAT family N-acetyltransferase [Anaerolineaceae bacterium]|nr:GNAT family N-acetyltransferase [Anaerolineaceae bacterium]
MESTAGPSGILAETDRLILRVQQAADVPALINLWLDPLAMRYMGGPRDPVILQPEFDKVTENPYAERYDLWTVVEKQTGRVIGHCGLIPKDVEDKHEIELVYLIDPAVWGRGYAAEISQAIISYGFDQLGLHRLIALIEPENKASQRVAEKLGMSLEKEVVRPSGAIRKVYSLAARS